MVAFPNSTSWEYQHDPFVTMQFTNYKDKGVKEVYEGDVYIEHSLQNDTTEYVGTVVWDDELLAYVVEKYNGGFDYLCEFAVREPRAELAGNIYENNNLLQKTNEDN